jgi:hypothetical protein
MQQEALLVICGKKKKPEAAAKLIALDGWKTDLKRFVRERKFMTKEELVKLTTWKLSRGTFRPALLSKVESNSPESVADHTKTAFKLLDDGLVIEALSCVTKLVGIGPATGSAILSAYTESVPFMSDESLMYVLNVPKSKLRYSLAEFKTLLDFLQRCIGDSKASIAELERCIWAQMVLKKNISIEELLSDKTLLTD